MEYSNILLEKHEAVALVRLNRPKVYNALNNALMNELTSALEVLEADEAIRAVVITGNEKAFAAGADIAEVHALDFSRAYRQRFISANWETVTRCRKPSIAAVAGLALGGGCELAMMCDLLIAADNARFGQPEIKLGIIPGAGGTQRLTRYVGKSKAMEMCLTGRMMEANEAERSGLASRVVPVAELLDEALKTAAAIASMSRPSVFMAKTAVNKAYETTLTEGVAAERIMFQSLFATEDQKEGMAAFAEKRPADFKNR
ncbi:MAG TPA: enoyl-CoA hydratase [Gammaproteobacteria bacterium]|nr:enoyl-CoA hydratase [Gammaproteobacteria bacterium]